jgi:hypothetical protein
MKRLIAVSLIMAAVVLAGGVLTPTHAQSPPNDLKPTFISPTPGLYVNGWPAFTVSYPKEWVEVPQTGPGGVFMAAGTHPDSYPSPVLAIAVFPAPLPLEEWAKLFMPVWVNIFTDIKVLSDKPSQSRDGTPAREVEFEFVPKYDLAGHSIKNAPKNCGLQLMTKKDVAWVSVMLTDYPGKLGEDLRGVASSLTFQPGREEPVQVPPDVRAFFDMGCADTVNGDVKTLMTHFSDRFRHSGASKGFYEQIFRNDPASPIQMGVISCKATVTVFEPRVDKAYLDGFWLYKAKGDGTAVKMPMGFQQIINEHGQWMWFGNQK